MKRQRLLLVLVFLFSFGSMVQAEDEIKEIKSKIEKVTVYLDGAQINRTSETELYSGVREYKIRTKEIGIVPSSIQVKGMGEFTILSVRNKIDYLTEVPLEKDIKILVDSVEYLTRQVNYKQFEINALGKEEQMIMSNQRFGSEQTGLSVTTIQDAADFYRKRILEIGKLRYDLQQDIRKKNTRISVLNSQIYTMRRPAQQMVTDIIIKLKIDKRQKAKFDLTYYVSTAGWQPEYVVRAKDVKSDVKLEYKANVWQSTGVDWKNIKLVLSTGNPNLNNTKPTLDRWYLSYNQVYKPTVYKKQMKSKSAPMLDSVSYYDVNNSVDQTYSLTAPAGAYNTFQFTSATTTAGYTTVISSATNINFDISLPYSIPDDGQTHEVMIAEHQLPATYLYYCAPKLDETAYLTANIAGWEKYNLLDGKMSIFFEDTYVGETYLNTGITKDTLVLSLGRDEGIHIERTSVNEESGKVLIGSKKIEERNYKITVRNAKSADIRIVIEDQIPISREKTIEVEADYEDCTYDEENGKLTWRISLDPGEKQEIEFGYKVTYPSDFNVYLR